MFYTKSGYLSKITKETILEFEEAFLKATLETNEGHSRGWALQYGEGFDREREALEKLKKALNFYERIEATTPEDERWQLM